MSEIILVTLDNKLALSESIYDNQNNKIALFKSNYVIPNHKTLEDLRTIWPNDPNKNLTCLHKDSTTLTKTKGVEIVTVTLETD